MVTSQFFFTSLLQKIRVAFGFDKAELRTPKLLISLVIVFALTSLISVTGQTIPGTGGSAACGNCVPMGWTDNGGTPDISDQNVAAGDSPDALGGYGASWTTAPLSLPPTGDNTWITMRDLGSGFTEESVSTTMGDLVAGRFYVLSLYTMSNITNQDGGAANNQYYAGTFINTYDIQIGGQPRRTQGSVSQNTWGLDRVFFIADPDGSGNMNLTFFPGTDGARPPTSESRLLVEMVALAIELDAIEEVDTDDDGIVDQVDIDDDNDGIIDDIETTVNGVTYDPIGNEDGDNLPNYLDTTDDGNGGDGSTTNYTDSNSDGVADIFDFDLDGIPNQLDLDSDNDGVPDNVEGQTTKAYLSPSGQGAAITDANNNGLDDNYETAQGGSDIVPVNTDGIDEDDFLDIDSDNDGALDTAESGLSLSGSVGSNGLDNNIDNGDGYLDVNGSLDNTQIDNFPDSDGDISTPSGDVDYRDAIDGIDTDGDGIVDGVDIDDDNDGILDVDEGDTCSGVFQTSDANGQITAAGGTSEFTYDVTVAGVNIGDTVFIDNLLARGDLNAATETFQIGFNNETLPTTTYNVATQCGALEPVSPALGRFVDIIDIGGGTPGIIVDVDASADVGLICGGGEPAMAYSFRLSCGAPGLDSDNDGIADSKDLDSDNDGIPDNIEAQTTLGYIAPSGSGAGMTDANNNGLDDNYESAQGGSDITAINTDDIGDPDYLDLDSDDDGIFDILESGRNVPQTNGRATGDVGVNGLIGSEEENDSYNDVNGNFDNSQEDNFPDSDGDVFVSGGDVDYRDDTVNVDTDNDGVFDAVDIDDDNDGILDVVECVPVNANVQSAQATTGVTTIANVIGAVNGTYARWTVNGNISTLDFGQTFAAGSDITVVWRRFPEEGGTAQPIFDESLDASSFGTPFFPISTTSDTAVSATFQSTQAFRYLRITKQSTPSETDFDIDAITVNVDEATCDDDADGVPNSLDLDSDNDGIPDIIEAQPTTGYVAPSGFDDDNDGLDNSFDDTPNGNNNGAGSNGLTPENTDETDNPDYLDLDSDNDTLFDIDESGSGLTDANSDGRTDGAVGVNGLDNTLETTDDYSDINGNFDDTQFDNFTDSNSNAQSASGDVDYREDVNAIFDRDGDGIEDSVDIDDDNDGILDVDEDICNDGAGTSGRLRYQFYDSVPAGNTVDNISEDSASATGAGFVSDFDVVNLQSIVTPADGDTFSIRYLGRIEISTAEIYTFFTTSDDGSKLFVDGVEVVDNDGDQAPTEGSGTIALTPGVYDFEVLYFENGGGQTLTVSYQTPTIAKQEIPFSVLSDGIPTFCDTDGDGIENQFDLDSDNDGIPDIIEGQSTLGYVAPSDVDTDQDGLDDAFDSTPNGGNLGIGSEGIQVVDTDGVGNPDYLDLDSDEDGLFDNVESGSGLVDANTDGRTDGIVGTNGLANSLETTDTYNDANGNFDNTQSDNFTDADSDVNTGGDVDYRDDEVVTLLINANDDFASHSEGTTSNDLINVLDNDTLDGAVVTTANVVLTTISSDDPGITLDANGNIDVTAAVNNGTFELVYRICETANPSNCDTATVTVTVSNTDRDNDGIPDSVDIDDDNDGILDTDECTQELPQLDLDITGISPDTGDSSFNTSTGNIGDVAVYNNIGTYDGQPVSLSLTVVDNSAPTAMIVNLQSNNTGVNADFPIELASASGNTSVADPPVATIRMDFFNSNTSAPVELPARLTFRDLDFIDGVNETVEFLKSDIYNYGLSATPTTDVFITETTQSLTGVSGNYISARTNSFDDGNVPADSQNLWWGIRTRAKSSFTFNLVKRPTGTGYRISRLTFDDRDSFCIADFDADGIINSFDLDSDNDGIPDNIEAQSTTGYIAPSGGVGANGLFASYENNDTAGATGLTPANTDGSLNPDYLDLDSDNDGLFDIDESGSGLTDGNSDGQTDGNVGFNGLDDTLESSDNYASAKGDFDNTQENNFDDEDGDVNLGGDVDYRDTTDDPRVIDAVNDSVTTNEGIAADNVINVLDNDTLNGNPVSVADLTVSTISSSEPGITLDAAGQLSVADTVEAGTYNLVYQICQTTLPANCDTATVIITVNAIDFDTDGDGVIDSVDIDDDNDGIIDEVEESCMDKVARFETNVEAFWTLDENTDDVSGNGNDERSLGGTTSPTYSTDTVQGTNAANFDGVDDVIRYSQDGGFMEATYSSLSFSVWIKPDVLNGDRIIYEEGGGTNGLTLWIDDNTLTYSARNGGVGSQTDIVHPTVLTLDGIYHHVAATFDSGIMNLYLDGIPATPVAATFSDIPTHTSDGGLGGPIGGGTSSGTADFFDGLLDAARYSNTEAWRADNIAREADLICDEDGDGIANRLDLDSDNDGIPDIIEAQTTLNYIAPAGSDNDGDGLDDNYDQTPNGNSDGTGSIGLTPENTDDTDNPDYLDLDSDDDSIFDIIESGSGLTDVDNDGRTDGVVGDNGLDNTLETVDDLSDVNGTYDDTQADNFTDTDGDVNSSTGDVDYRDNFSDVDTDQDGIFDRVDIDDDNDGITDLRENNENVALGDKDGDGILNYLDNVDNGDGGDGSATDYTDNDGNGIPDVYDLDGDGVPNHLDLDTDNDGIPDIIEAQPTVGYVVPSGSDNDGDGLDNAYDDTPDGDPDGAGSNGIIPQNTDDEDLADYKDLDSDNDGLFDIIESGDGLTDADSDGRTDGTVGNNGLDNSVDNGGIDNYADTNGKFDDTQEDNFTDTDGDVLTGGDVDYRDQPLIFADDDVASAIAGIGGDGIINVLDNDSVDGAQATVADVNITQISTTNAGVSVDLLTGDVDVDPAVPAGTYIIEYRICQDSSPTNCDTAFVTVDVVQDTDIDGIPDDVDIDDDNDGILDIVESCSTVSITNNGLVVGQFNVQTNSTEINDGLVTANEGVAMNNVNHYFVLDLGQVFEAESIIRFDIWGNSDSTRTVITSETPGAIYLSDSPNNPQVNQVNLNNTLGFYDYVLENSTRYVQVDMIARAGGRTEWVEVTTTRSCLVSTDTDNDGVFDQFDLDSDNDGIPDNVEAQSTTGYILPLNNDADGDGLDDAYDDTPIGNPDGTGSNGLTPENTDSGNDTIPDYLDLDSDNDGIFDLVESGDNLPDTNSDGRTDDPVGENGLDDNIDSAGNEDGYNDVNGIINSPEDDLDDTDGDVNNGGDVDYRDIPLIDAVDDSTTAVEGVGGVGLINVLDNDTVDGVQATISNVDITQISTTNTGVTVDPVTGNIDVAASVPAGTYIIEYRICQEGATTNCENAFVTVIVERDTDEDGIPDSVDIDDDNDGILDSVECGAGTILSELEFGSSTSSDVSSYSTNYSVPAGDDRIVVLVLASEYTPITDGTTQNANVTLGGVSMIQEGINYGVAFNNNNNYLSVYTLPEASLSGVTNSTLSITATVTDQAFAGYIFTVSDNASFNFTSEFFDISPPEDVNVSYSSPSFNASQSDIIYMFANSGENGSIYTFDQGQVIAEVSAAGSTFSGTRLFSNTDGSINLSGEVRPARRSSGVIFSLATTCADSDGDGLDDFLDLDSDNDGIPDNVEGQPTIGYITPTYVDSDGDGLMDVYDSTPNGGPDGSIGITPENTDETDLPDYLDLDSDNDGIFDLVESGDNLPDSNNDGRTDDPVGENGLDNNIDSPGNEDGYDDVNGIINSPEDDLDDTDGDVNNGGDVDYRDGEEFTVDMPTQTVLENDAFTSVA
ncbi:MAG: LamG-like jellyroll fold domain-containing protein, partial [Nonlabens sp.]